MKKTWILVCDAWRARLFAKQEKDEPWKLVEERLHPESREKTSEMVSDRSGRTRQSGTGGQPAMEPSSDPAEVAEQRFAAELADLLHRGLHAGRYTDLVLVATPRFLGYLRKEVSRPVRQHVVATVDKDYVHVEARDLPAKIRAHLPPAVEV